MATGRNSSFGYIFIAGQVDGQYDIVNWMELSQFIGFAIFYCNFDKIGENTDLATWLKPFQGLIWLVLIFPAVLSFTIFAAFRQRQNPIYRDPLRFLGCFFLVFKEPVKRSPLSLNVMFIVSLQILASHYEYFFTARLIIPPHFKELSTLKEFIDEGFVLLYEEDVDYGVVREEYLILEDLKIQGIPSEIFNNSFQPVRQVGTINDLLKFISPDLEHRKNVYYGSVNYQEMFRIGMETNYNNLYKCYIAKNVNQVRPVYFQIQTILREKSLSVKIWLSLGCTMSG